MKKVYRTITTFASKSKPGKVYTVKMDESSNLSCDCPRWLYHRDRDCYHVRVVRSEMKENPIKKPPVSEVIIVGTKPHLLVYGKAGSERYKSHWFRTEYAALAHAKALSNYYGAPIKRKKKENPEEKKIRKLVGGTTASERKAIREAEESEIRDWLTKIQSAKSLIARRAIIKDMINQAKKEEDSIRVVGEVIKRGRLHEEVETMRLRKLLNPQKIRGYCPVCHRPVHRGVQHWKLWYHRQCLREQEYGYLPKYKARRKQLNPVSLYQSFHGVPESHKTKVYYEEPPKELIGIGELKQLNYQPRRGQHHATEFFHKSGDTGSVMLRTNMILATDPEGKNLYLVKKSKSKRPYFSSRGIIG